VRNLVLELMVDGPLDDGTELLRLIERHVPEALPEKCGTEDPPRERFSWDALGELWGAGGFLWRAKGVEGEVIQPQPGQHESYVLIDADPARVGAEALVAFVEAFCARHRAIYGHVHLVTEADRGRSGPDDPFVNGDEPNLFVTAEEIADSIPALFWTSVLGPPLVDRIGRDRVLGAPVARCSEPSEQTVVLQLTDRVEDLREDYAAFDAAREQAKHHLGAEHFFDPARPPAPATADGGNGGGARSAADLIRDLTEYGLESLLEDGSLAPLGVAVPEEGGPESIGAPDFPPEEATDLIEQQLRAYAGGREVVLAAVCNEDESRHTKVPDERRVLRIRLEARGERPFVYFQPVSFGDGEARLEEGWTEAAEPRLLSG
jgi:hypothetical protein